MVYSIVESDRLIDDEVIGILCLAIQKLFVILWHTCRQRFK
jgi:hypothetical protein